MELTAIVLEDKVIVGKGATIKRSGKRDSFVIDAGYFQPVPKGEELLKKKAKKIYPSLKTQRKYFFDSKEFVKRYMI